MFSTLGAVRSTLEAIMEVHLRGVQYIGRYLAYIGGASTLDYHDASLPLTAEALSLASSNLAQYT